MVQGRSAVQCCSIGSDHDSLLGFVLLLLLLLSRDPQSLPVQGDPLVNLHGGLGDLNPAFLPVPHLLEDRRQIRESCEATRAKGLPEPTEIAVFVLTLSTAAMTFLISSLVRLLVSALPDLDMVSELMKRSRRAINLLVRCPSGSGHGNPSPDERSLQRVKKL